MKVKIDLSYIIDRKWYILDMSKPRDPRIIRKSFERRKQAKYCIETQLDYRFDIYFIERGEIIKQFGLDNTKEIHKRLRKYEYKDSKLYQEKKSFRTKERRKQREENRRKVWKPKSGWKYPKTIKTSDEKRIYRMRIRKKNLRKIKREK